MKAFKKCICLFLSIILVMSSFIVVNAAETSKGLVGATSGNIGDCTWSFNSGVLTISGNGSMGEDQGSSYPWKSLGDSITSVVIGKGVTDVSGHAFLYQQNISSVNISETVTDIGSYAFGQCWMTSVVIPNSVKSIGAYAFHGCTSLNKVTIGNGCTTIHLQAFWNCISLKSVTIPKSVTSIGSKAFACSSLVGYSSPDTSFIIYGYPGTSAENYAKNNSLNFVSLDSNSPYKLKSKYPQIRSYVMIPYESFKLFDKSLFDEVVKPYPDGFGKTYYKGAIPFRNRTMVSYAGVAICYVGHKSRGSAITLETAQKYGVKIYNLFRE